MGNIIHTASELIARHRGKINIGSATIGAATGLYVGDSWHDKATYGLAGFTGGISLGAFSSGIANKILKTKPELKDLGGVTRPITKADRILGIADVEKFGGAADISIGINMAGMTLGGVGGYIGTKSFFENEENKDSTLNKWIGFLGGMAGSAITGYPTVKATNKSFYRNIGQ